jgi:hypothetical protein
MGEQAEQAEQAAPEVQEVQDEQVMQEGSEEWARSSPHLWLSLSLSSCRGLCL